MILPLRLGSKGADVRVVQEIIGAHVDGDYGELTRLAVKDWQRARGLPPDGVVGPATWERMEKSVLQIPITEQNQQVSDQLKNQPVEQPGNSGTRPTPDLLARLDWTSPAIWSAALAPACARHGITTKLRLAAFLANVGNETNGGRVLVENLSYSAPRLMAVWPSRFPTLASAQPFAGNPQALAEKVYGGRMGNTQSGDGYRFRGRGGMQTTGRSNYQRLADAMGRPLDDAFLAWLETPEGAAESAAFFFEDAKMAVPADKGDIRAARIIANGGTIGLAEVEARYAKALAALSP